MTGTGGHMLCAVRDLTIALIATALTLDAAGAEPCAPVSVSYDSTHATPSWLPPPYVTPGQFVTPGDGIAAGQTFVAPDTLIASVKVWAGVDSYGMHLYIVGCADGVPQPTNVIVNGPVTGLGLYDYPYPYRFVTWTFDPPVSLPGPGVYAFFIQSRDCRFTHFSVLADTLGGYPGGALWMTRDWRQQPDHFDCFLPALASFPHDYDLCFEINFCSSAATPARRRTWGALKMLYR